MQKNLKFNNMIVLTMKISPQQNKLMKIQLKKIKKISKI